MPSLPELLKHGEHIFTRIDELVESRDYAAAYAFIDMSEPPVQWIIEGDSKIKKGDKYKTIPLDIMEGIMKRIFGEAGISTIASPVISQNKDGKFASTVVVGYQYMGFDGEYKIIPGIATISVNDISMLELASPKASSMAVKNALKQLGGLFGKYLNDSEDKIEIPEQKIEPLISPEEERVQISQGILAAKTKQELGQWRLLAFRSGQIPELQEQYECKLRELTNKK